MDKVLGNKKAIVIFILPAFIIYTMFTIVPIFISAWYSLLDWNGMGQPLFVGLSNYIELFTSSSSHFWPAAKNSLILAILSIVIQIPIGMILAIVLAMGVKKEKFFRTVYFIPVILSTVVIGQLWMKIYHPSYGMLNTFLGLLGLESWENQWLGNQDTALIASLFVIVWQYIGYHMLLMYSAAKSIPESILEAAKIDGVNGFQMAIRIIIPLISPIIKVCIIFAVIGSFKSFDLIYILTNGGPVHASEVPATLMYNTIFSKYRYGLGSTMSIFIIIECLVAAILMQKVFKVKKIHL